MKSISSSWSFLRDSPELRGVLKYQFEQQDFSLVEIGQAIGVNQDRLSKYFRGKKPSITNYQLVKLANFFGIELSLDMKFLPPVTPP